MHLRWQTWLAAAALIFFSIIIYLADQHGLPDFIANLYAFPNGDKVGHFFLMGSLSFCINLALRGCRVRVLRRNLLLGSLLTSAGVTLEEFSQIFIPGRTFDLLDLAASLAGIWLLGYAAGALLNYFTRPRV